MTRRKRLIDSNWGIVLTIAAMELQNPDYADIRGWFNATPGGAGYLPAVISCRIAKSILP